VAGKTRVMDGACIAPESTDAFRLRPTPVAKILPHTPD